MQELYNIQVKHSPDALVDKSLQILNKFLTETYKKKTSSNQSYFPSYCEYLHAVRYCKFLTFCRQTSLLQSTENYEKSKYCTYKILISYKDKLNY